MFLLTTTNKGIFALELQRKLGYKRYASVCYFLHKLGLVMGGGDEKHLLNDSIELNEAFISIGSEHRNSKAPIL